MAGMVPVAMLAQSITSVSFTELGRFHHPALPIPAGFSASTLHSRIDRLDRGYLFMACTVEGLITLDIGDPATPTPVDTIAITELAGLQVNDLEQYGDMLVVALGGFEGASQSTGVAIIDISDPENAFVRDLWNDPANFPNGCATAKLHNGHLYLGAMESGVVVLDASDPDDLQFISTFQPDPTWPGIAGYAPNARGIEIVGDLLYLAYDAGGLRVLGISDPSNLTELGRYVNPSQPPLTPPAYNKVLVRDGVARIAVDFCGLETVGVSEPASMQQTSWLNPWSCLGFSWYGSDGHTNEVMTAMGDSLLLVSGADTEVLAYDISAGGAPIPVGGVIQPNDTAATWSIDVHGNLLVGNFINNHGLPLQPYDSKYGGVVLYAWEADVATGITGTAIRPCDPQLVALTDGSGFELVRPCGSKHADLLTVHDAMGRLVSQPRLLSAGAGEQRDRIELNDDATGLFLIRCTHGAKQVTLRGALAR